MFIIQDSAWLMTVSRRIIRGITLLTIILLTGCSTGSPEPSGVNSPTKNEAFNESLESFDQLDNPGTDNFLSPQY
ncbi:MAG: hypothetical protein ACYSWY_04865 [Planctomycetota bacterium]